MLRTFTICQGDTRYLRVPLLRGRIACPVAGWSFWMTAQDADGNQLFQKSTAGSTILPYDANSVYARLAPADTIAAEPGRYICDAKGLSPSGDPYTLERFYLQIERRITTAA